LNYGLLDLMQALLDTPEQGNATRPLVAFIDTKTGPQNYPLERVALDRIERL